jgi:hypothetical protein
MTPADVSAALELLEGLHPRIANEYVAEAVPQATEEFPAMIYGSGGYHRYALIRKGDGYELKLMLWSLCGVPGDRKLLESLKALGLEAR